MDSIFKHQSKEAVGQIEVIAVDDGSNDESAAFLDEYAAGRDNMTVMHQENSGSPANPRNRAIEIAKGEYIFFADADDWFYPHAIEEILQYVKNNSIDVGVFEIDASDWDEHYGGLFTESQKNCTFFNSKIVNSFGPLKLFRRRLLTDNNIRFPEGCFHEDQAFCLECYVKAGRIDIIAGHPYLHYTKRTDGKNISVMHSSMPDSFVLKGLFEFFDKAYELTTPEAMPMVFARCIRYTLRDELSVRITKAEDETEYTELRDRLQRADCDAVRALLSPEILVRFDAFTHCTRKTFQRAFEETKKGCDFEFYRRSGGVVYSFNSNEGNRLTRLPLPEEAGTGQSKFKDPEIQKIVVTGVTEEKNEFRITGRVSMLRNIDCFGESMESFVFLDRNRQRSYLKAKMRAVDLAEGYKDVVRCGFVWECTIPAAEIAKFANNSRIQVVLGLEVHAGDTLLSENIGNDRVSGVFTDWIKRAVVCNDTILCPTETKSKFFAFNLVPVQDVQQTGMLADFADADSGVLLLQGNIGFDNYPETRLHLLIDGKRELEMVKWGTRGNRNIAAFVPVDKLSEGEHLVQVEAAISGTSVIYKKLQVNGGETEKSATLSSNRTAVISNAEEALSLVISAQER